MPSHPQLNFVQAAVVNGSTRSEGRPKVALSVVSYTSLGGDRILIWYVLCAREHIRRMSETTWRGTCMSRVYSCILLLVLALGALPAAGAQASVPAALDRDFMGMAIRDPWYEFN